MKLRKGMGIFFGLVINLLVLLASTLPHHHHKEVSFSGTGCEYAKNECTCSPSDKQNGLCEYMCPANCLSIVRYLSPETDFKSLEKSVPITLVLFLRSSSGCQTHIEKKTVSPQSGFIEKLHDCLIFSSSGLRAPPHMVFS